MEQMTEPIRPGYETERRLTLSEVGEEDGFVNASPAECFAMVWPMTLSCWSFVWKENGDAQPEFQRYVERVIRGRG